MVWTFSKGVNISGRINDVSDDTSGSLWFKSENQDVKRIRYNKSIQK